MARFGGATPSSLARGGRGGEGFQRLESHTLVETFHQDLARLVRIAIVGLMATGTLLVVTVLLYEGVLAEETYLSQPRRNKPVLHLQLAALNISNDAPSVSGQTLLQGQQPTNTTVILAPQRRSFDLDNFSITLPWNQHKKSSQRGRYTFPRPFKTSSSRYKKDPLFFLQDENAQNTKYRYPGGAKSIQEIIRYFRDADRDQNKNSKDGMKVSGSFNSMSPSSEGVEDQDEDKTTEEVSTNSKPNSSLEEFRLSADPIEVNNALLGVTASPITGLNFPRHKHRPLSVMLDIYPMTDAEGKPMESMKPVMEMLKPSQVANKKPKYRKKKPSYYMSHGSQHSSSYPSSLHSYTGSSYPVYHSSSHAGSSSRPGKMYPYYSSALTESLLGGRPPSSLYSNSPYSSYSHSSSPYSNSFHSSSTSMRNVMRPENNKPHNMDSEEEALANQPITLRLNLYPKKNKLRGIYERVPDEYSKSSQKRGGNKKSSHKRKGNSSKNRSSSGGVNPRSRLHQAGRKERLEIPASVPTPAKQSSEHPDSEHPELEQRKLINETSSLSTDPPEGNTIVSN